MPKTHNMTGMRFGRVVAQAAVAERTKGGGIMWQCVCDCGRSKVIDGAHLRKGVTRSCGCLNREMIASVGMRITHGLSKSRTYTSWLAMKNRCTRRSHIAYKNYGGRGITVCEEWLHSFETFLCEMGERPEGKTLDRVDSNAGYNKNNCRWATTTEQNENKNNNRGVVIDGFRMTLYEACAKYGVRYSTAHQRLSRGWTDPEAFGLSRDGAG